MSRITKLPPEQWTEELRNFAAADTATELELGITRMLAHAPKAAMGPLQFGAALAQNRTLPERLIELMRLRIAFHNQCKSCMAIRYDVAADSFSEDDVCSLERPAEAENLDERERLAVDFGERFATNHLSVDDDYFERLKSHFSEAEIIELMLHCALYVGMGRMAALLDMTEELPAGFQVPFGETVTPTADSPVRVR
jgi:alkylhydroperoxidase family enzyme